MKTTEVKIRIASSMIGEWQNDHEQQCENHMSQVQNKQDEWSKKEREKKGSQE